MKSYDTFEEIRRNVLLNLDGLMTVKAIKAEDSIKHVNALRVQTESQVLALETIIAIVKALPEVLKICQHGKDRYNIYIDTPSLIDHCMYKYITGFCTLLHANSTQRGAIEDGAYYILESGTTIRLFDVNAI